MTPKIQFIKFLCFFSALACVSFLFSWIDISSQQKIAPTEIELKKRECVAAGGSFVYMDFSLHDDNSDYRIVCTMERKKLWEEKLN